MKALAVVLALILMIGCLVAANWLGSQTPRSDNNAPTGQTVAQPAPPVLPDPTAPKIAPAGPYPKAVAAETEFDFGVRQHLSKGHHAFVIHNEGEAPLELVALKKDRTCQCTGATLASDEPVPPGGKVVVNLEWEIRQDNPNFRHSAKVRTNDPENPVIELAIRGKTEKGFQFSPAGGTWDLGDVSDETVVTSSKVMYSRALESFDIREAVCANPRVTCTWEPIDEETLKELQALSGYRLKLNVDLDDFSGVLHERLEIATTEDPDDNAVLMVHARRKGPVEFIARNWDPENNRLFLGEFPAGEGKSTEINVYTRVEEEVNLLSAQSQHEAVDVSWEEVKKGKSDGRPNTRRYRLKIAVKPGPPVQRRREDGEKVELKFDHPKIGTMQISVEYLAI